MRIKQLDIVVHLDNGWALPLALDGQVFSDHPAHEMKEVINRAVVAEYLHWSTLFNLPMQRPPRGAIEATNDTLTELIELGAARESSSGFVTRTPLGDELLAQFKNNNASMQPWAETNPTMLPPSFHPPKGKGNPERQ